MRGHRGSWWIHGLTVIEFQILVEPDAIGPVGFGFAKLMGFVAVTLAAVNIFGGFIVTQRMLQMFQRKK